MFINFAIPVSWGELLKRTFKETISDDCMGLAAQLSYFFFLALFPAILFLLALASFFPATDLVVNVIGALRPIAPQDVLVFLEEQLRRVSNADSGGILTFGMLGAIWSSSAGVTAIISTLNRAYDIEEGRPWWKVRLVALGLTLALAVLVIGAFALVIAGSAIETYISGSLGTGTAFAWGSIIRWPGVFAIVCLAVGLVYYFGPDADQDWVYITPGAVTSAILWIFISLGFKFYTSNFGNYNATYGAVGAVIVLLLWFYMSGLAILVGAEMNAEIEHASPHGKEPGEKIPGQRRKIGPAAARAFKRREQNRQVS